MKKSMIEHIEFEPGDKIIINTGFIHDVHGGMIGVILDIDLNYGHIVHLTEINRYRVFKKEQLTIRD